MPRVSPGFRQIQLSSLFYQKSAINKSRQLLAALLEPYVIKTSGSFYSSRRGLEKLQMLSGIATFKLISIRIITIERLDRSVKFSMCAQVMLFVQIMLK